MTVADALVVESLNNYKSEGLKENGEEVIPTAIVIKNIPFTIKKEELLEFIGSLKLPLPYAFNYHFDNGVFRGLAFANFNTVAETKLVVKELNGIEISGRKLKVELKKLLPQNERDRIEKEKKEKKLHHNPPQYNNHSQDPNSNNIQVTSNASHFNQNYTTNNATSTIPSTNATYERYMAPLPSSQASIINPSTILPKSVDFNDPDTLDLYSQILLFKDNDAYDELAYPIGLSVHHRNVITTLTIFLGLVEIIDSSFIIIRKGNSPVSDNIGINFQTQAHVSYENQYQRQRKLSSFGQLLASNNGNISSPSNINDSPTAFEDSSYSPDQILFTTSMNSSRVLPGQNMQHSNTNNPLLRFQNNQTFNNNAMKRNSGSSMMNNYLPSPDSRKLSNTLHFDNINDSRKYSIHSDVMSSGNEHRRSISAFSDQFEVSLDRSLSGLDLSSKRNNFANMSSASITKSFW